MKVKCENCKKSYNLTEDQEKNVKEFAQRKTPFMVSRCPLCHSMVMLEPLSLVGITNELPQIEDNRLFYCPSSCCVGFIEYDKDSDIYNCAECGSIWKNKKEIFESISSIVKRYSHRNEVYKKTKNGWKSIKIGTESNDYYKKVQNNEKL